MDTEEVKKAANTVPLLHPLYPCQVIELYGEEGTGKSQCLFHMLAQSLLPPTWQEVSLGGLGKSVLYIDNDHSFSMLRLTVMLEQRILDTCLTSSVSPSEEDIDEVIKTCLSRLYIVSCSSSAQLIVTLHSLVPSFKNNPNLCLIMIDSISAFYWIDRSNGADNIAAQEANMVKIANVIGVIKEKYNVTVYATKHAVFMRKGQDEEDERTGAQSKSLEHCEYLCKTWQKLVSQRWILTKAFTNEKWQYRLKQDKGSADSTTFYITDKGVST